VCGTTQQWTGITSACGLATDTVYVEADTGSNSRQANSTVTDAADVQDRAQRYGMPGRG